MRDKRGEIILSGPAGTGKSRACLEKLYLCACKYPGMRALIVRKTRTALTETGLVTWEDKVLPENSPLAANVQRKMRQSYSFPNGSEIITGGLDNITKIMSSEYDMVYVQEAIEVTEDDWEKLTTRLRNGVMPYQQIIADTNPDAPTHWIKQRQARGQAVFHESRHEDNPTVTEQYLSLLRSLTGTRRDRLYEGRWVQAEGIVYPEYDARFHLKDRFEISASWPRYWVFDFGYTHPFVWQAWAEDPDGRLYRYREIYMTGRLVEDHAARILQLTQDEPAPQKLICDHDAEDRATLERKLNRVTVGAKKSISDGLQAVSARLRKAGDGKPRIFFLRDSLDEQDKTLVAARRPLCTEDEFDSYVWPSGRAALHPKSGEQPVKEFDHGLDCARYMVAEKDLQPAAPPLAQTFAAPKATPLYVVR